MYWRSKVIAVGRFVCRAILGHIAAKQISPRIARRFEWRPNISTRIPWGTHLHFRRIPPYFPRDMTNTKRGVVGICRRVSVLQILCQYSRYQLEKLSYGLRCCRIPKFWGGGPARTAGGVFCHPYLGNQRRISKSATILRTVGCVLRMRKYAVPTSTFDPRAARDRLCS